MEECPICFDNISLFYKLNCNHQYCYKCIHQLKEECAICRSKIKYIDHPDVNLCVQSLEQLNIDAFENISEDKNYIENILNICLRRPNLLLNLANKKIKDLQFQKFQKIVNPFLSSSQRYMIDVGYFLSDSQFKWLSAHNYRNSDISQLNDYLVKSNPLVKQINEEAKLKWELISNSNLLKHNKIKFHGLDPLQSTVELEDGTIMNLLQYSIYCSDDQEKFVEECPQNINDQLVILNQSLNQGIKNIFELRNMKIESKNAFRVDMSAAALYYIIKRRKKILVKESRKEWIRHIYNSFIPNTERWNKTVKYLLKNYRYVTQIGDYFVDE